MSDLPTALFMLFLMAGAAVLFVRENISALDALSAWAAARAWGLRCAKVEYERRMQR